MRWAAAGVLVVSITAALAGCGNSQLSLKDLRTQASAICQSATTKADRIQAPSSPSAAAGFLAAGAAVLRPELTKLRALVPPSAQASQYHTATGTLAEELQLVDQAHTSLAGRTDGAAAVGGLQRALVPVRARGDAAWRALGIAACVSR
jgi:hypothetical protein